MKPFRHEQHHDVNVEIPTQDLEDLVEKVGDTLMYVIGFYMVADTARHILKRLI